MLFPCPRGVRGCCSSWPLAGRGAEIFARAAEAKESWMSPASLR